MRPVWDGNQAEIEAAKKKQQRLDDLCGPFGMETLALLVTLTMSADSLDDLCGPFGMETIIRICHVFSFVCLDDLCGPFGMETHVTFLSNQHQHRGLDDLCGPFGMET